MLSTRLRPKDWLSEVGSSFPHVPSQILSSLKRFRKPRIFLNSLARYPNHSNNLNDYCLSWKSSSSDWEQPLICLWVSLQNSRCANEASRSHSRVPLSRVMRDPKRHRTTCSRRCKLKTKTWKPLKCLVHSKPNRLENSSLFRKIASGIVGDCCHRSFPQHHLHLPKNKYRWSF